MTITYSNGRSVEAALLTRSSTTMRVAIQGTDDATVFTFVNGTWVSEDCEPAQIRFEWQRKTAHHDSTGADPVWSVRAAARLVQLVISEGFGDESQGQQAN